MKIEQKQNRIYKPQSVYTYAAEECNQVSTELNNLITEGGLTPSAGDLTQVKTAVNNIVDTAANNLQEQIDAITSASDVYDVVGTYAQLEAYDKSTVPLNDIIKVLQDSTHNNAATYYRLVETSGATEWQYIGQEGPYYTKSEIDTDFALKSELPSIATVSQVGLIKPDNQSTFVGNDGTLTISSNVAAALPLFTFVWADHLLNDASYLRADTFSWQSGNVYTEGYNHLVADISGITSQTETIGSYTITYYQANDGHKIVLADQETTVQNIFNESGVAWYYVLDTTNTRFKLPRTKYGFTGLRDTAGKYVPESLPNHDHITHAKGTFSGNYFSNNNQAFSGGGGSYFGGSSSPDSEIRTGNASESNSVYQDNAPVQQRATQMYLYFYVGNFSQSATEQTAGLNSELFNEKADIDLSNAAPNASAAAKETIVGWCMPDYDSGIAITYPLSTSPYTCPSDGIIFGKIAESGDSVNNSIYINGVEYDISRSSSSAWRAETICMPFSKGDVIYFSKTPVSITGFSQLYFAPMKGV